MSFIDEIKIDKNNLMKNFKKINNIATIKIINCYQTVFKKENLIKNYGFYILIFILLTLFICIILFCSKYYQAVIDEINEIIKAKKNLTQKNEKIETRGQKNKKPKTKKSKTKKPNQGINLIQPLRLKKTIKRKIMVTFFLQRKRNPEK